MVLGSGEENVETSHEISENVVSAAVDVFALWNGGSKVNLVDGE